MERNQLIGLIHIARGIARVCPDCGKVLFSKRCRDCGTDTVKMDQNRYRKILESFGSSSCRFMDAESLEKVYGFFIHAGFKPRSDPEKSHERARRRTIAIIRSEARKLFGDDLWESRLSGFVHKAIGKPDLMSCDDNELRKAIGWLRRYRIYLGKRREEKRDEERD